MIQTSNKIIRARHKQTGKEIIVTHLDVRMPIKNNDVDNHYTEKYVLYKKSLTDSQLYGMRYHTYSNNYIVISEEELVDENQNL